MGSRQSRRLANRWETDIESMKRVFLSHQLYNLMMENESGRQFWSILLASWSLSAELTEHAESSTKRTIKYGGGPHQTYNSQAISSLNSHGVTALHSCITVHSWLDSLCMSGTVFEAAQTFKTASRFKVKRMIKVLSLQQTLFMSSLMTLVSKVKKRQRSWGEYKSINTI